MSLREHGEEEQLCRGTQGKVDTEVAAARRALAKALEDAAREQWEPLERGIRDDAKLRAKLIAILCLVHASCMRSNGGSGGSANWEGVLADAFPHPTDEEFAAGIEAACRQLATEE